MNDVEAAGIGCAQSGPGAGLPSAHGAPMVASTITPNPHDLGAAETMKIKDTSRRRLGKRIRMLRVERELSLGEFANRTNLSRGYISFLQQGVRSPSLETLIVIAKVLDVSLSELFLDVDRETPKEPARLSAAIAGQPIGIQRRIFRIVEEMLGAVRELKH